MLVVSLHLTYEARVRFQVKPFNIYLNNNVEDDGKYEACVIAPRSSDGRTTF